MPSVVDNSHIYILSQTSPLSSRSMHAFAYLKPLPDASSSHMLAKVALTRNPGIMFYSPSFVPSTSTIKTSVCFSVRKYVSDLSAPLNLCCCHVELSFHHFSLQEPSKSSFYFHSCPLLNHSPQGHQHGILNSKWIMCLSFLQFSCRFVLYLE